MTTASAPTAAPAASAEPKRRITPKEWAKIEALWEEGDVTYVDLVKRYGASVSTFERHFKKNAVIKGAKREETKKRIAEQLAKTTIDDATVLAARIKETKEEHYKMAAALSRLTWNEVLETKRAGTPVAMALNNLKALDAATTILKKIREERFAVLGLDRADAHNPDEIPELVISELTAEQVEELRARDHTEMDGAETAREGAEGAPTDLDDEGIVDEGGD